MHIFARQRATVILHHSGGSRPFVFSVPVLTSCSSDTDDGTEAVDYQSLLSAQEWEVTEACQSFGGFGLT